MEFFTPRRIDLVCKYAFFRDLLEESGDKFVLNLYSDHILKRTKGREPIDKFNRKTVIKRTIDDYITSATALFHSMQENGFDKTYPVPYSDEGVLLNGAHRIACAAVLELDVVTEIIHDSRHKREPWDLEWFKDNHFSEDQIEYIADLYDKIKQGYSNEKNTA